MQLNIFCVQQFYHKAINKCTYQIARMYSLIWAFLHFL